MKQCEPGDVRRGCKNEHAFQIKLCFLRAAFSKVCTGKMLLEIGAGGDGKGMEAYLDKNLLGEHQTATLDCGVFLDPQEFRKSGEFACRKCNVRIQGMDSHGRFIADIWKRFVVDKEIDCRVNYGFTSKRKFGDSMKVQELNVMEEVREIISKRASISSDVWFACVWAKLSLSQTWIRWTTTRASTSCFHKMSSLRSSPIH